MNNFVSITPEGRFELEGRRWFCNSVIYFGHFPGAMQNWFTEDVWPRNKERLERDFARMQQLGLNHSALFLSSPMFFEGGKPVAKGYDQLDHVIEVAKRNGVRLTLFTGPFIDTEEEYFRITGRHWEHDDKWLPPFNPALFDAYVQQVAPMAQRYRDEPTVLGYGDRIDRFHKGFDNISIPFNLKDEWASHLQTRFGTFEALREAVGGKFENEARDWNEVLLPQESRFNAGLANHLGHEYILWQKQTIGDAQARWDAEIEKRAPHQVFWTPFEGCTLDWAMLDGFTPEPRKLRAIWMEFYHWQAMRSLPVGPFEEWSHTPEVTTQKLAHESPSIYSAAYLWTRYIKLSTLCPVVVCHGARLDSPATGAITTDHQLAIVDRVNAAALAADGDGWHYWSWTDDWQSSLSHDKAQKADPTAYYWQGESMGLYDYDDHPRPVTALLSQYSAQLKRKIRAAKPAATGEVLLLSSAAQMLSLFRRMAFPTAGAVGNALFRCGVEPDYLWTARNALKLDAETLNAYKLVVIADPMFGRDARETPPLLLDYVRAGGTLYLPLADYASFEDEFGVRFESPAIRELAGVDESAAPAWPGANERCRNWPFPGQEAHEPNYDALAFPRLMWGVTDPFRAFAPVAFGTTMLGYRSLDGDRFTAVPSLKSGAEVMAVAKFDTGSKPFLYRHRVGAGTVYVNAWTNTIYRDCAPRQDFGGWEWDWILAQALETADVQDVDLTRGAGLWLRNTWGYFAHNR